MDRPIPLCCVADPSQLLLSGKKNSVEGLETDFALCQALDFVANCAKHPTFFTEYVYYLLRYHFFLFASGKPDNRILFRDRALLVCNAVVAELENTKVSNSFLFLGEVYLGLESGVCCSGSVRNF